MILSRSVSSLSLVRKMISSQSINAFFAASARGDNDATNAVRENVLAMLLTPAAEEFCLDAEHGERCVASRRETASADSERWSSLRRGWREALGFAEDAAPTVKKMAGRKYNYDFSVTGEDGSVMKVEFKSGAGLKDLSDLPQILSLSANFDMWCPQGENGVPLYAEHFYKMWLPIYMDADGGDEETRTALPELDKYMKLVHQSNYDRHPFFRRLYDREEFNKKEKAEIVDQSISSYLLLAASELDLEKISAKLQESQSNKRFVMWDSRAHVFHTRQLVEDDLRLEDIDEITKNSIVVRAVSGQKYKMLLRWKNHKGVLLPAWQISFGRCEAPAEEDLCAAFEGLGVADTLGAAKDVGKADK